MILKNKNKKKYKKHIIKIYYKKMKLETLQGKPKRKYVRKSKETELETTLNNYIINTNVVEDEIMRNNDNSNNEDVNNNNIINELDNEINENLSKSIKRIKLDNNNTDNNNTDNRLFLSDSKELELKKKLELKKEIKHLDNIQHNVEILSTINRSKPTYIEKVYYNPNVINVKDYEFMNPINVYLYYVSEKIGKNLTKYVFYTHIYKHVDHHILCSTHQPFEYKGKECKINEKIIQLTNNVTLYVKEYIKNKGIYTYESCQKSLNRKRKKEVIENGFDYDFCQLRIEGLEYKHKNSYIFKDESKYFSFTYDI